MSRAIDTPAPTRWCEKHTRFQSAKVTYSHRQDVGIIHRIHLIEKCVLLKLYKAIFLRTTMLHSWF